MLGMCRAGDDGPITPTCNLLSAPSYTQTILSITDARVGFLVHDMSHICSCLCLMKGSRMTGALESLIDQPTIAVLPGASMFSVVADWTSVRMAC